MLVAAGKCCNGDACSRHVWLPVLPRKITPEGTGQGMRPDKLAHHGHAGVTFVSPAEHRLKRTRCRHSIACDLFELFVAGWAAVGAPGLSAVSKLISSSCTDSLSAAHSA